MASTNESNDTILVVEENQRTAFLLEFLLTREGYRVAYANPSHPHGAMEGEKQPPKLILMGSRVSFADNNRMITQIRKANGWKSVPIIVLIESFVKEKMLNALDAGANDFLLQPFDTQELVAQITRHTALMH